MKSAYLITFSQTVRVIVDGDEPSDTDIENAFVKASEAMTESNVEALDKVEKDSECPYGTFENENYEITGRTDAGRYIFTEK